MNKQGCLYPFFAIFALAGLACGAWGVSNLNSRNRILKEGIETTGTIIGLSGGKNNSVAPIVGFEDQRGRSIVYHSNFHTNMTSYGIGQKMRLWYLPSDPNESVVLEGSDWTGYFPFLFLFTHGGLGIGGLIWLERKRRLRNWLNINGQRVKARFLMVDVHRGKSTTYTIVCEWTDTLTGTKYKFRSESLGTNPEALLPPPNDSVWVLIDPSNPKRYWVDVSFVQA
jgi:hypothetical protein